MEEYVKNLINFIENPTEDEEGILSFELIKFDEFNSINSHVIERNINIYFKFYIAINKTDINTFEERLNNVMINLEEISDIQRHYFIGTLLRFIDWDKKHYLIAEQVNFCNIKPAKTINFY